MKITDEMVHRALAWFYPCEDWPPSTEPTAADEIAFRRDRMEVMRGTLKAAFTGSPAAELAEALRGFVNESITRGYSIDGETWDRVVARGILALAAWNAARRPEPQSWRPRSEAPDSDDEIIGYQPEKGDELADEIPSHCSVTTGRFLRSGGWEACTHWLPLPPFPTKREKR